MKPEDVERAHEAVVGLLQAPAEQFVRRAYALVLGRTADETGLKHYAARLADGQSRASVVIDLARSREGVRRLAVEAALAHALLRLHPETATRDATLAQLLMLPDIEFVHQAVQRIRGLPAEDAQVIEACCQLRGGLPRHQLLAQLARTSGQRLEDVLPDARTHAPTETHAARDMAMPLTDAASVLTLRGRAFVDAAYQAVLGREPDAAGALATLNQLARGRSRDSVLRRLADSEEGRRAGRSLPGLDAVVARHRWHNLPLLSWLAACWPRSASDSLPARWQRRREARNERFWADQARQSPDQLQHAANAAQPHHDALEAALLARFEALLALQRDNFERELLAWRTDAQGAMAAPRRASGGPCAARTAPPQPRVRRRADAG